MATAPSLWAAHCHCGYCRKAQSAAFTTWVGFPADTVEIEGAENLSWYGPTEYAERAFCTKCGTTIFYRSETGAPGELHITLMSFDDPIDRAPQAHAFYDHRVPWLEGFDDLKKRTSDSAILAPYTAIPKLDE